jgi:hypothetical protein
MKEYFLLLQIDRIKRSSILHTRLAGKLLSKHKIDRKALKGLS